MSFRPRQIPVRAAHVQAKGQPCGVRPGVRRQARYHHVGIIKRLLERRTLAAVPIALCFTVGLCRESRSEDVYIAVGKRQGQDKTVTPAPSALAKAPAASAPGAANSRAGVASPPVNASADEAAESQLLQQRPTGPLRVEKFQHLRWNPATNSMHADGPVTVTYKDPATSLETVLTSSDLDYDAETDRVRAPGMSTVTRPDGRFQGRNIDFNVRTNTGRVESATVVSDFFRMSGAAIERRADGSYHLSNGDFTTCIHGRPDYKFQVKDLTVQPDRVIKAHNIRLYLGGFALPPLPYLRRSLSSSSTFPFPTPGYDRINGISLHLVSAPIERKNETLDLNLNFNLRRAPTGFGLFQHDIGATPFKAAPPRVLQPLLGNPLSGILEQTMPTTYREYTDNRYNPVQDPRTTFFAIAQNQLGVYNRRNNRLIVSRFPEVGVQFLNLLGRPLPPGAPGREGENGQADGSTLGVGAAARYRAPNTPAILNVTAGVGEFIEDPTHVSAGRISVRTTLATQPILLGRRLSARAGVTDIVSLYTKGSLYQFLAPEAELNITPTRDSLFNIGYRYVADIGRTPFLFDRRDIRHELRLQYQVSGPWGFGIASKIDLERSRAYDGEIAVVRNFDCMRVGLVYQLRTQSFGILFNLLPARRDKSRPLIPLRPGL